MTDPTINTKYEKARIIGARALQISMGAPLLTKFTKEDFEKIKYNPIEIAKIEYNKGLIPITVVRASARRMDVHKLKEKSK